MESGHESGRKKHLKTGATVGKGAISAAGENANSPSSSSSSDTSLDDFFCGMDGSQSTKPNAGTTDPPILDEDVQLAPKNVLGDLSPKSGKSSDHGSQSDTFPMEVTVNSPGSSLDGLSATQSPQIQVMGRSGEPDPNRIPASVFATNMSTTPMEWSVASNESLFSIHVGNNSFSKDHIFLMGKSGELGLSGELINFPDFPLSHQKTSSLVEDAEKSTELGRDLGVTEAAAETVKEVMKASAEDCNRQKMPPADGVHQSSSHSHRSDGSGTSINSFAFPIKKRCAWPFCYCCNCSWALCCTWAFCYCCNGSQSFCQCCRHIRACCHCCKRIRACCHCCKCGRSCCHCCNRKRVHTSSYSTLTGEGGRSSDSVKADSDQQSQKPSQSETQPQAPGLTPKAAGGNWFPCFSCCPFCC